MIRTILVLMLLACSTPKHREIDHRYDTPQGYYRNKPYFDNGGTIINISKVYWIVDEWYFQGNPLVIVEGKEKEFENWINYWRKFALVGTDKQILERKKHD